MYSGDIIFVLHVNYFKDMKKYLKYCLLVWIAVPVWAQQTEVIGPDSHLKVNVALKQGKDNSGRFPFGGGDRYRGF